MNVTGLNLSASLGYSLFANKKEKERQSFLDFVKECSSQMASAQAAGYTASSDAIRAVVAEDGTKFTINASYTVTEEEAEYFREKYGENYNEATVADLFYELAEKEIISHDDACRATCSGFICILSNKYDLDWLAATHTSVRLQDELVGVKYNGSRNIFSKEYREFKRDYDNDVITWEDFIQEQRDFYEYMRNRDTIYDAEGKPRPNDPLVGYDERLEGLERAAEIIKQIFG